MTLHQSNVRVLDRRSEKRNDRHPIVKYKGQHHRVMRKVQEYARKRCHPSALIMVASVRPARRSLVFFLTFVIWTAVVLARPDEAHTSVGRDLQQVPCCLGNTTASTAPVKLSSGDTAWMVRRHFFDPPLRSHTHHLF